MKIAAVSDLHSFLPPKEKFEGAELLLIAGDTSWTDRTTQSQMRFWNVEFRVWAENLNIPIILIAGNHCEVLQYARTCISFPANVTYLEDSGCKMFGLSFWGTPWTVRYGSWAFMSNEESLAKKFALIPHKVDFLLSHGPPKNHVDLVPDGTHAGSDSLLFALKQKRVKNVITGHLHGNYGQTATLITDDDFETKIYNVSYVDESYKPTGKILSLEV